jgi:hypothetical protein
MIPFLLTIAAALSAALYALAKLATLDGASLLGLLYWQAMSSAVIVSVIGALAGYRPQFSLRLIPRYAIAVVFGICPVLIAGHGATKEVATGLLLVTLIVLLVAGSGAERPRGRKSEPWSSVRAAGGMLILQALALDPIVAHAHAIVLPGPLAAQLDWALIGTSVFSSALYVTVLALSAHVPWLRRPRWTSQPSG